MKPLESVTLMQAGPCVWRPKSSIEVGKRADFTILRRNSAERAGGELDR